MHLILALLLAQAPDVQSAPPVIELPDPLLDDTAAFEGYRTRFHQDAAGNTVQIYLDAHGGRVVHLWADAANESVGFTARDEEGAPASLEWGSNEATIGAEGTVRWLEYRLRTTEPVLEIGHLLLGSMRVERDLQYAEGHLRPFGPATFRQAELERLIEQLERLENDERRGHLERLDAADVATLRARLEPEIARRGTRVRVTQPSFDGRNRLALELSVEPDAAELAVVGRTIRVSARSPRPVELTVRISTDSPALTPLARDEIFNEHFFAFYERVRAGAGEDRLAFEGEGDGLRFRRLERQVRSFELLSSREKLVAGLPNFATYFGRDILVTALLMEPAWTAEMLEHVLGAVLRKLGPDGGVSHEEALGGQAIRERAAIYNERMDAYFAASDEAAAAHALAAARAQLDSLQVTRENYHMVDDEFQLPPLAARYLADPRLPRERKLAFLRGREAGEQQTRLERLLRNVALVAELTGPYADSPGPDRLISFARRPDGGWAATSWRDSGAGYADGRFAMDVNAIWVPLALRSTAEILSGLLAAGVTAPELQELAAALPGERLDRFITDHGALREAITRWAGAGRHFAVAFSPEEVRRSVAAKLDWLPAGEAAYWRQVLETGPAAADSVRFLALALDSVGEPIPVMSTDPAMALFLGDATEEVLRGQADAESVLDVLRPFLLPYPVGLFVDGLGPLVANDVYAHRRVWERFRADHYHSPRVVWGREVTLLLAGLARQIGAAYGPDGRLRDPELRGYVASLEGALDRTRAAVEASGLEHNELWSYRVDQGRLVPVRYRGGSDLQLWSLTDLAVELLLDRMPRLQDEDRAVGHR